MAYFEVTVKEAGLRSRIGIGIVSANFPTCRAVGQEANSIAYHGDTGMFGGVAVETVLVVASCG